MFDFNKIANFRLAKGSHKQPNPDGNICINEAAIIADGFEYKEVRSAYDCPPCFSRIIAQYAIKLNDAMPDDLRQKLLMPFVLKLSGTADAKEIEIKRAKFIALENCRRIMSMMCKDLLKRNDLAELCLNAKDLKEAENICRNKVRVAAIDAYAADAASYAASYASYAAVADAAASTADAAAYAAVYAAAYANYDAAYASYAAVADDDADHAAVAAAKEKHFTIACQIMNEAILLGKHQTLDEQESIKRIYDRCKEVA